MTASPRKQRQQRQRESQRAAKAATAQDNARREEHAAELIAPQVQRLGVISNGEIYQHPRLKRDGVTFIRSNPIDHLIARGGATKAHGEAAKRMRQAWEDGGQSVHAGCSNYGERVGGVAQSGYIDEGVLKKLAYQNRQKAEFEGACAWLGMLFPVVRAVVLEGIDIAAWARVTGRNPQEAKGYLLAALDRMVEFYTALRVSQEAGPARIRSVVIGRD